MSEEAKERKREGEGAKTRRSENAKAKKAKERKREGVKERKRLRFYVFAPLAPSSIRFPFAHALSHYRAR